MNVRYQGCFGHMETRLIMQRASKCRTSTWDMAKDGKAWFDPRRQREISERIPARRARLLPKRKSLQARLLAKWRAK